MADTPPIPPPPGIPMTAPPGGLSLPAGTPRPQNPSSPGPSGPPPQRVPIAGTLIAGWRGAVNLAHVVNFEVWESGKDYGVVARMNVLDRDGQPVLRPMTAPTLTEDEAHEALDRLLHTLPVILVGEVLRPPSIPRPAL